MYKLSYWDVFDGSLLREIEGGQAALNGVSVSPDGNFLVTAGNIQLTIKLMLLGADKLVKVWDFETGNMLAQGSGHCGVVTAVKVAPNGQYIVSVADDGAIYVWHVPESSVQQAEPQQEST